MKKLLKSLTLLGLATLLTLPSSQAAKQTTNWRVLIRIDDIHCIETEDFVGYDEFYTLSAFTLGLPDGRQVVRTASSSTISINNGNHKKGTTILDVTVPSGTTFSGQLIALDEDVDKDWSKVDTKLTKAGDNLAEGMKGAGGKKGAALGSFLKGIIGVIGGVSTLDQDDLLGEYGFPDLTIRTERNISETIPFKNSAYFSSDWNYKIKYSIKVTPTYNQPNL